MNKVLLIAAVGNSRAFKDLYRLFVCMNWTCVWMYIRSACDKFAYEHTIIEIFIHFLTKRETVFRTWLNAFTEKYSHTPICVSNWHWTYVRKIEKSKSVKIFIFFFGKLYLSAIQGYAGYIRFSYLIILNLFKFHV